MRARVTFWQVMAGQRIKGQALADNGLRGLHESLGVRQFASVESEGLLVEVTKQMERFDRHVGAFDGVR